VRGWAGYIKEPAESYILFFTEDERIVFYSFPRTGYCHDFISSAQNLLLFML
jgi:hypothetical protein